jgi:hypothetical protein
VLLSVDRGGDSDARYRTLMVFSPLVFMNLVEFVTVYTVKQETMESSLANIKESIFLEYSDLIVASCMATDVFCFHDISLM